MAELSSLDKNANQKSFPYPSCWDDDERMAVLFAPFRIREVNPENYDSKLKFWQDMIALYCAHIGSVVFSKLDLQTAFTRGDRILCCLDTVITDLYRSKKIRMRCDYEYDPLNSWTGWALNGFLWRPLAWSVGKLKTSVGLIDNELSQARVEYIHLNVMHELCKKLRTKVLDINQGKLLHYPNFKQLVDTADIQLTEDTLCLCLHTLHYQRKIALDYKVENKERRIHLVKIPSSNDTGAVAITETDHAIHNLQMTQASLANQLEELESEITAVDAKIRQHVKENRRQLAKRLLRKKHFLDQTHEKRVLTLHNIDALLNSVDEARSQGEILDAYKIGSRALQAAGLKYDNVDEVVGEVRESLDTHREVQDALGNTTFTESSLSAGENDELERELCDILSEEMDTIKVSKEMPTVQVKKTPTNCDSTANNTTITDAELLAMLEQLEVEEGSIRSGNPLERTISG